VSGAWRGLPLLINNSAWERQNHPAVAARWRAALEDDTLVSCAVTDFELLFSARDAEGFDAIEARLAGFRHLQMTEGVHRAARHALCDLTHTGPLHHRVKLPDVLMAACAQEAGAGVIHYDHDFDRLAKVLTFESQWLAPPGTLD
jgi:predicted nucleic acid-binding protein